MKAICIGNSPELMLMRKDDRYERTWSDFQAFHGKYYPRHFVMKDHDEKIIDGTLSITEAQQLKSENFVAPAGFETRRCVILNTPPVWIKGDNPQMPATVWTGSVVAALKIGVDGRYRKQPSSKLPTQLLMK